MHAGPVQPLTHQKHNTTQQSWSLAILRSGISAPEVDLMMYADSTLSYTYTGHWKHTDVKGP